MKFKKTFGWILFLAGVLIIFWSLWSSYNIFSGKKPAPQLFAIESSQGIQKQIKKIDLQKKPEEEIKRLIEEQINKIIPPEIFSKIFNLISWSVLAGLLIFGGSRISGLGIKLIK